jgi:hypothetical protein
MKPTEFAIKAWLAQLSQQTGQRLTWEHRYGVQMIRCNGHAIGTMSSTAAVETFLRGFERGMSVLEATRLDQAA